MKTMLMMAAIAVCCLATPPAFAQTAGEDLQRAIFAEEVQGNIDNAIQAYRQLANSSFAPRDVAAHAQYRLSQALLKKSDLPGAKRELERMERDFSGYRTLIASLTDSMQKASKPAPTAGPMGTGRTPGLAALIAELGTLNSDVGAVITIRGKVTTFQIEKENASIIVESDTQRYAVVLPPPGATISAGTINRTMFKVGEAVTIDARHPYAQPKVVDDIQAVRAYTIFRADGAIVFKR